MKLKKISLCSVAFLCSALLLACGDKNITEITTVESFGSESLAMGQPMPECSVEKEGALLFVSDSSALYCCARNKWNKISATSTYVTDTIHATDTLTISEAWTDTVEFQLIEELLVGCEITEDSSDCHKLIVSCSEGSFVVNDAFAFKRYTKAGKDLVDARDGNVYKTVIINSRTWMAEDLHYVQEGCRSCQNVNGRNEVQYSWLSAMNFPEGCDKNTPCDVGHENYQGICPDGWHLPSKAEWESLFEYVDSINGDVPVLVDLVAGDYGTNLFGLNLLQRTYVLPDQGDDLKYYLLGPWSPTSLRDEPVWIGLNSSFYDRSGLGYALRCVKND